MPSKSFVLLVSLQFLSVAALCAENCKKDAENLRFNSHLADSEGLVTVAPLTIENLISAYRAGAFPWTEVGPDAGWYSINARGVLDFDEFHVPSSLKKEKAQLVKSGSYRFAMDENFEKVIQGCAEAKRPQEGTWISSQFITKYTELHRLGYAHSFEVYINGELAGGAYGVFIDGLFSGESMFYHISNGGKFAFWEMVEYLKSKGFTWMDTQMVTKGTKPFGTKAITREEYLNRLAKAHLENLSFR